MKKRTLFCIFFLFFAVLNLKAGGKRETVQEENYGGTFIAAGETGGTYYSYSAFLAPVLSRDTNAQFSIISTRGSVENLDLIKSGRADLAIVQNDIADHAWKEAHFFEGNKNTDFAAIAALYSEICQIIAGGNSGIRTISDLNGKRVSIGAQGSGTEVNAKQILEAYSISLNRIEVFNLGFGESVEALKNNRIDAFFCVAGTPTPAIAGLAESSNIVFLEIDDDHVSRLVEFDPYYTRFIMPSGTYRGQNRAVRTLALKAVLIAGWGLSDDFVYALTKSLFENREIIARSHRAGTELSLAFANDHTGITIPFHPGAARFYREIDQFPVLPLPRRNPD